MSYYNILVKIGILLSLKRFQTLPYEYYIYYKKKKKIHYYFLNTVLPFV